MDPNYTARLFQIESGGDPYAVTGSNRGLGQFSPDLERKYGITDYTNADQQARAVEQETSEHTPVLTSALGRAPSPGELYFAHQQGLAGAQALLANPDQPAWRSIRPYYKSDAIAKQAITGNIPRGSPLYGADPDSITSGDFSKFWVSKFEGGQPQQSAQAAPQVAPQAPQGILASAQPQAPQPSGGILGGPMDSATENVATTGTPNTGGIFGGQQQQQPQQPQMPAPQRLRMPIPPGLAHLASLINPYG